MSESNGLPKGWAEATLSASCEKIQDGTHFSPPQESQKPSGTFPYVTAKNVRPWGMDLDSLTYLEESEHRSIYERCDTRKGDVLLVKDGDHRLSRPQDLAKLTAAIDELVQVTA